MARVKGVDAVEQSEGIVLQNDRIRIVLGKAEKGGIVSVIDRATGRDLVVKQIPPPLFKLTFRKKDDMRGQGLILLNQDAVSFNATPAHNGGSASVKLDYMGFSVADVQVTCGVKVSEDDELVRWRISARFPDSLVLEQVEFPFLIVEAPLRENVADDVVVIGCKHGGEFRRPAEWNLHHEVSAGQYRYNNLAAQFGCYYDEECGVFTAAYDGDGYPKNIHFLRVEKGIEIRWVHHCFVSGSFSLNYDVVLTVFRSSDPAMATDWRDAADIYKRWALTQPWCERTYAEREDIPDWMKAGPAMVRFTRDWLAKPDMIEWWINFYWRKYFGELPLIVAYWGWEKGGPWISPDYFPVYPSDEEFKKLVEATGRLNCHAFLWPSGYHWTVTFGLRGDGSFEWDDRVQFEKIGRTHAVIDRDGSIYQTKDGHLKGGENVTMCPGDAWTRKWLNDIAVELAKRGADLIQIDQVVGAGFPTCFSTNHGHPPGSGSWKADVFSQQLATMLVKCRQIRPELILGFEEPQERFIQYVGIQDYRDFGGMWGPAAAFPGIEPASIFNYLYHEFLPTFQSNPTAGNNLMHAYCLVNGQIPHFVPVMGEEAPPDHKIMSQWTMLFSGAGRPYLLFGRMLHPPKLDVETVIYDGHVLPAILHNAFRAPDGTEAVIAVNITNEKRKGLLDWKGKKTPIELDGWEVRLEK